MTLWTADRLMCLAERAEVRIEELMEDPKCDSKLFYRLLKLCSEAALVQQRVRRAQRSAAPADLPRALAPSVRELEEAAEKANRRRLSRLEEEDEKGRM